MGVFKWFKKLKQDTLNLKNNHDLQIIKLEKLVLAPINNIRIKLDEKLRISLKYRLMDDKVILKKNSIYKVSMADPQLELQVLGIYPDEGVVGINTDFGLFSSLTSGVEDLIFHLTNQERRKYVMKDLAWSTGLSSLAKEHSQYMAENNIVSHYNKADEDINVRFQRRGFVYKGQYGRILENIVKTEYDVKTCIDELSVAKRLIFIMFNNAEFSSNLLNGALIETGIGVSYDGINYYLTQVFS
ncbi:MAG: CAP domain-containing protein [Candidatus Bathyarchaeia archaeon]|jgi:uncharacterized protein YkwD